MAAGVLVGFRGIEAGVMKVAADCAVGAAMVYFFGTSSVVDGDHGAMMPVGELVPVPVVDGFCDFESLSGGPGFFEEGGGGAVFDGEPNFGVVRIEEEFVLILKDADGKGVKKFVRDDGGV